MIENLFGAASQGGAAGVTGFTPSQNTAAPNNTVNASRLLVDAGTTNADAVTADNTNDALVFTVTGENAKTIRWVATVHLTKVTG